MSRTRTLSQNQRAQDQDTLSTRRTSDNSTPTHSTHHPSNPMANPRTKCNIGKKTVYVPATTNSTSLGEVLAALALRGHSEVIRLHEGMLDSGVRVETLDFFPTKSTLNFQIPPPSAPENKTVAELVRISKGELQSY